MQFARLAVLAGCSVLAFAQAGFAAPTLIPMDEAVTTLASPASANPAIPAFQYNFGANSLAMLVTENPLLCGNTAAATGVSPTGIMPVYYSANGSVGISPKPFVFGAASDSPSTSAIAYGATNVVYNGNQVRFGGDPLDALVCYGLDANGVHKVTRDLFADDFEVSGTSGILGNSSVALNVIQLPNAGNGNYYVYTIDIDIPPLPSGTNCTTLDCNFALVEGYDTSVFDTTSGQWCAAPAGATSCVSPPPSGGTAAAFGDININYSNYGATVSLLAPIGGTQHKSVHFVAFRKLATGVTALPVSGAPVVMAALFSPRDLEENKLDDNVATGNNTLANVAPIVSDDAAFATAVSQLSEGHDSASLNFTIQDPDSSQGPGTLSATANLTITGQVNVMLPVSCSTPSGNPLSSTCSLSIPLGSDPSGIWDTACSTLDPNPVTPPSTCYLDFATDTTNGTYAPGVSASIKIVATDAQGKNSAPVSTPVHINSTKNDAPVVTFGSAMPTIPDQYQTGTPSFPTYTCSISAGSGAGGCGNADPRTPTLISINVSGITATPGPAAAFDEMASQTTMAMVYAGLDGGNVACTNEQTADVFAPASGSFTGGGPLISSVSGAGTSSVAYGMNFVVSSTAPATSVSALCTLSNTIGDQMQGTTPPPFPNSESAATAQSTFRIVVNP